MRQRAGRASGVVAIMCLAAAALQAEVSVGGATGEPERGLGPRGSGWRDSATGIPISIITGAPRSVEESPSRSSANRAAGREAMAIGDRR